MHYLALALLLLAPSTWAAPTSEEFLKISSLLNKAKLNLVPVETPAEGKVLLQVSPRSESEEVRLLGFDGKLHPLELMADGKREKTSVDQCGEPLYVAPRKLKDTSVPWPGGRFALVGKLPAGISLSWKPVAVADNKLPKSCSSYRKKWTTGKSIVSKVEGLKSAVFFLELDHPNLPKLRLAKSENPGAECGRTPWQLQRVGVLTGKRCRALLEAPVDCEGHGYRQGSLGPALGMISIEKGKSREEWLVFDAKGVEGQAYLGIRLRGRYPARKNDIQFYVFSGC